MEEQKSTVWVHRLAYRHGLNSKEFRKMLKLQYGTKHTKLLSPEQLKDVKTVLKALPRRTENL